MLLLVGVIISGIILLSKKKHSNLNEKLSIFYHQVELLENLVKSTNESNLIQIADTKVSCKTQNQQISNFFDHISLPCLVIYIPVLKENCLSCVDFAINKAKTHFKDFEINKQIMILSSQYNSQFKSRVYGKEVFHIVSDFDPGLGIPADSLPFPQYLLINNNHQIISSFMPKIQYEDLVDNYLTNLKRRVFVRNSTSN